MFLRWIASDILSPTESSVMMGLPMPITDMRPFSVMGPHPRGGIKQVGGRV